MEEDLREIVISKIDMSKDISDEEISEITEKIIFEYSKKYCLSATDKFKLHRSIVDSIRGLDILEEILDDENITEIMINGYNNIFIEKNGTLTKYNGEFSSKDKLLNIIQQIVGNVNRRVNEASPIVDSRLKDGSRVNIVLNPIALNGPVVTIRKFPKKSITMDNLIEWGSITREVADFLKLLVVAGYNIFISGGTGSGKTTFLNVLSNYIPEDERVITIEDSAELQLQNILNLVRLESRDPNDEGDNEISIRQLIRSSLRMRPDRIVVGEVRGGEAMDMLQAMNTGHDGSLSTGHANSPEDMLRRLETMVLMGVEIPISAVRGQIASGIDIIVHLSRLRDKTRKVTEIIEVCGMEKGEIKINSLYKFCEYDVNNNSKIVNGELKWTGNGLINIFKLLNAGYGREACLYGKRN